MNLWKRKDWSLWFLLTVKSHLGQLLLFLIPILKKTEKQSQFKANTNPIAGKAKTNAFSRKGSFKMIFTILHAKLITLKGDNFGLKIRGANPIKSNNRWYIYLRSSIAISPIIEYITPFNN